MSSDPQASAAASQEFRVRQGDTGKWHVDRHVGIFAETVATYDTREEAEMDRLTRRTWSGLVEESGA